MHICSNLSISVPLYPINQCVCMSLYRLAIQCNEFLCQLLYLLAMTYNARLCICIAFKYPSMYLLTQLSFTKSTVFIFRPILSVEASMLFTKWFRKTFTSYSTTCGNQTRERNDKKLHHRRQSRIIVLKDPESVKVKRKYSINMAVTLTKMFSMK